MTLTLRSDPIKLSLLNLCPPARLHIAQTAADHGWYRNMPALILATLKFTAADSFAAGIRQFIVERSLVWTLADRWGPAASLVLWLQQRWSHLLQWLSEPGTMILTCCDVALLQLKPPQRS